MPCDGGMSAGERFDRLQEEIDGEVQSRIDGDRKLWEEVTKMKVEWSAAQVKVAILVGAASALLSGLLSGMVGIAVYFLTRSP